MRSKFDINNRFQGQYDSDSNRECEDVREVTETAFKPNDSDPETLLFVQFPQPLSRRLGYWLCRSEWMPLNMYKPAMTASACWSSRMSGLATQNLNVSGG